MSSKDSKIRRARELAQGFLALMNEKEKRDFRRIARGIVNESEEDEEESAEVDAEIAKAAPPRKILKKEEPKEGTYLDRNHSPFTELTQSVFGTRFVPMTILRDAAQAHLGPAVTVEVVRPGFLRLSKPVLSALAQGSPPNNVYAVWYDELDESMLVRLDDWLTFGRRLYDAGRSAGLEMSTKANERYGSRGIARASRFPAVERWAWRWIDFDVVGNARDGFEVDRATRTNVTVELSEHATDQDILRELRKEVLSSGGNVRTILLEHHEDGTSITVSQRKGNQPLGRLERQSRAIDA